MSRQAVKTDFKVILRGLDGLLGLLELETTVSQASPLSENEGV